MSKYTDHELGHAAESDGIEEFDNPLPDWWVGMFFLSAVWAALYATQYHVVNGDSQAKLYDEEVALAKETWPDLDKAVGIDNSPATLKEGEELFQKNCASCHNVALTGGIGPNLVDDAWIHGGAFEKVNTTITDGVAAKGMPTWGPILGPKGIASLSSYILSKNEGEGGRAKNTAMGAYATIAPADPATPPATP
jgi:cytochrome c oxidase cbb3-type subunit 3